VCDESFPRRDLLVTSALGGTRLSGPRHHVGSSIPIRRARRARPSDLVLELPSGVEIFRRNKFQVLANGGRGDMFFTSRKIGKRG
jgi:hypothetical protein